MPIYKYRCLEQLPDWGRREHEPYVADATYQCEGEFEVFYTSISRAEEEEPLEPCPECGGTDKERMISTGTSFQLKGSGWAKDRYK